MKHPNNRRPLCRLSRINVKPRALSPGQSAVELALVSLVFIFLLLGTADFARVWFMNNEVETAARAGAQYGVRSAGNSTDFAGMQSAALNDAQDISGMTAAASSFCECPGSAAQFSCASVNTCTDKRTYVQVNTAATFTTVINWPGLPSSIPLKATATMRLQ